MSMQFDELMPVEIRHAQRPAPMNFAFRDRVDPMRLSYCRSPEEREMLFTDLKRRAARALADHIAQHCKWFDVTDRAVSRDLTLQLELTISDRGAYENWLPVEHRSGRREGYEAAVKQLTESLPYGLADASTEVYE